MANKNFTVANYFAFAKYFAKALCLALAQYWAFAKYFARKYLIRAKWTTLKPLELLVLVLTILKQYSPSDLRQFVFRYTRQLIENLSPYVHLYIDEVDSNNLMLVSNGIFTYIRAYLSEHGCQNLKRYRLNNATTSTGGNHAFRMIDGEEVTDTFNGVKVWWVFEVSPATKISVETRAYKLIFHEKHREIIAGEYLDYVANEGKMIIEKNRTRKLYFNKTLQPSSSCVWTSVCFQHPATFDNLAMDPAKKREIVDDLLQFSRGKDIYARIGKAWKRGYLLYGPPGTGKSTMIGAMSNLLGYDVYDLELTAVSNNEQLRKLLINTGKRSIIAIEDIDCSLKITKKRNDGKANTDKKSDSQKKQQSKVTLSGLLNFIDGIWSSSEGERIIVFTTNSLEKLDPALIRTGRMDKHIEMSYCCFEGFKVLAKNYLLLETHPKFDEVRSLLEVTKMTPADVAEHLLPKVSDDEYDERCLDSLICALEKARDYQAAEEEKMKAELEKMKNEGEAVKDDENED